MENRVGLQLLLGPLEQMTLSGAGASATSGETSNFHTALEECLPAGHDVALGDRSGGAGSSMEQKSEYFSARVEEMMRSRSQFSSDVEHEIAHSRVHWSEVPGLSKFSEDDDHEDEEVSRENRKVFAELMTDPQWRHHERGPFFLIWNHDWKLGQKIAEGGQGAIFEVLERDGNVDKKCLVKVFRRGSRLLDLKKQWPHGILLREVDTCIVLRGYMLNDGRFGFEMVRCWGDLRKLIDQAMQEKNNQGPPFPYEWEGGTFHALYIMTAIALDLEVLHNKGIIHRDLKAANVLLSSEVGCSYPIVGDYECSLGVVGTGFWRAPEILLALKNRSVIDFTKKVDVYSFGMTCFEVITGRLPFEGELEDCRASQDLVIGGQRPQLPSDLDVRWKHLIQSCWHPIPNERPSFKKIVYLLFSLHGFRKD